MGRDNRKSKAYEYLYDQIVSYKMKPGYSIVEKDVADALNISRTPVREALNQLETEGMILHIPSKGCFVSEMTSKDIEDIFFMRKTLEIAALELSFHSITPKELDEMEQSMMYVDETIAAEDGYIADRRFHELIVNRSNNARLISFIHILSIPVERLRRVARFNTDRPKHSKQEHLDIIYAMRAGDYEKTKEKLSSHLENVKENVLQVYEKFF